MEKGKAIFLTVLVALIVAIAVGVFFGVRAYKNSNKDKKLLDKDLTPVAARQAEDKNYKASKEYFEKAEKAAKKAGKDPFEKPNQEMARHAAYLADGKLLAILYKNDTKNDTEKENKGEIKWNDEQLLIKASAYGTPELIGQLRGYADEYVKKDKDKKDSKKKKEKENPTTLIHYAAAGGNLVLVKYFESNGLDINAKDDRGWQVIHFAASSGNLDLVKYLVEEKGFKVNTKNKYGQTALDYAKTVAVADYLKSKGGKSGTELR